MKSKRKLEKKKGKEKGIFLPPAERGLQRACPSLRKNYFQFDFASIAFSPSLPSLSFAAQARDRRRWIEQSGIR